MTTELEFYRCDNTLFVSFNITTIIYIIIDINKRENNFKLSFFRNPNREPGKLGGKEWPKHTLNGKEFLRLKDKYLQDPDRKSAIGSGHRVKECAFWRYYLPKLIASTGNLIKTDIVFLLPSLRIFLGVVRKVGLLWLVGLVR